jgi:tetratricopeptide (TPR) repeat protein
MLAKAIVALICLYGVRASCGDNPPTGAELKALFDQERWEELAKFGSSEQSADACFYYASALAHLGRWNEARRAFLAGLRLWTEDPRFPTELAGVAFKEKNYRAAEAWLRRAVELRPRDPYINDFLATVFFMEGNRDAAVKYWNRVDKPRIESIVFQPTAKVRPALLDRAFAFSRASMLTASDLFSTQARLDALGVFRTANLRLQARQEGAFDVVVDNSERDGCGDRKWQCLIGIFGELPARTVAFDYFNVAGKAINVRSLVRWDADKRRLRAELETPLERSPSRHLRVAADLREENWAIRHSFAGPASLVAALKLEREALEAEFTDVVSGNWNWSAATEFSSRSYHHAMGSLGSGLLRSGYELKQAFTTRRRLLRLPEQRLILGAEARADVGRLWAEPAEHFATLSAGLRLNWFPEHTGDRYQFDQRFRLGATRGHPPFDELFMLGVLGDTDLLMRAHIATRDGKKGSAPIGRNYFVSNWELKRRIGWLAPVEMRVGPFVDSGKIGDPDSGLGSRNWLWDAGIEARLEVFGFAVALSYARDLRAGKNAFVVRAP